MREMPLREARAKLGELAEIAHHGETVVLTKHGRPYARLAPLEDDMQTTAETRSDARDAIIRLAARVADGIDAIDTSRGVIAWRHSDNYEHGEDQAQRLLPQEEVQPRLQRIAAVLRGMSQLLDAVDSMPERKGGVQGHINDRGAVLDRALDRTAQKFLSYEGLTINGWENLLKPDDEGCRDLAEALGSYINPDPEAAEWALESARAGLAAGGQA